MKGRGGGAAERRDRLGGVCQQQLVGTECSDEPAPGCGHAEQFRTRSGGRLAQPFGGRAGAQVVWQGEVAVREEPPDAFAVVAGQQEASFGGEPGRILRQQAHRFGGHLVEFIGREGLERGVSGGGHRRECREQPAAQGRGEAFEEGLGRTMRGESEKDGLSLGGGGFDEGVERWQVATAQRLPECMPVAIGEQLQQSDVGLFHGMVSFCPARETTRGPYRWFKNSMSFS